MATKEEISMIGFEIVAYAGDAMTDLLHALDAARGGNEMDVTFIMIHAQDTLMTTMMLEKQTKYFIDEYKRLAALEAKLG